jgi:quercetin dioxygenase-like cupin family protein
MSLTDRPVDLQEVPFISLDFLELATQLRREPAYAKNGKNSRALVRGQEISLVLTVLKAGHELKPHHAPTSASVVVLEGGLQFRTHGDNPQQRDLGGLQSAVFSAQVQHSVKAVSDCAFLITLGGKSPGA